MIPSRLDSKTLVLVAWSVGMSVSAQMSLRTGMSGLSEISGLDLARAAASTPWVWLGIGLYLLATVSWLAVLSRIDLAVAHPLGAMNYVLVTVLSATVLHESVPLMRWMGTACVLIGVIVVAAGERPRRETTTAPVEPSPPAREF